MDTEFDYKTIKSDRRTLCIQILPDKTVVVRAPKCISDGEIAKFVREKRAWIVKHLSTMPDRPAEDSTDITALKEKAKRIILPRVEYWSEIMGLSPTSVKITSARRRFGSCGPKNGLCFSLFLAAYPQAAIDYVIVHELAHIKHKNHSDAFHALVSKYLPDQAERIKLLRGR